VAVAVLGELKIPTPVVHRDGYGSNAAPGVEPALEGVEGRVPDAQGDEAESCSGEPAARVEHATSYAARRVTRQCVQPKRASPALPAGILLGSRNGRPGRLPSGEMGADLDVMPFALRISVITFGSVMCQNI
jgi:hypothetical protein